MSRKPFFATIINVCTSGVDGPKDIRDKAVVMTFGLDGDYHCRPTNKHRHIHILSQEVVDDIRKELGFRLSPGALGENLRVRGLGNLSDLRPEMFLWVGGFGGRIKLKVTKHADRFLFDLSSCHPELPRLLRRRMGIFCIVEEGIFRIIYPQEILVTGSASFLPDNASVATSAS